MQGEEDKNWDLDWPWPPYTQEWWTCQEKDLNFEALMNQERVTITDDNLASTSEPEWLVNARADVARRDSTKKIRKPKPWKHPLPITRAQLNQMREEFWETAPHSGGQKEIWDVLREAAEAELTVAQAIVDSAGVIISSVGLATCYDKRGAKYELPNYVLSEPTNLSQESLQLQERAMLQKE
ncbi:hypothetical protein AQUCO_02100107v1 [Aquilegia coerulea]|uniref:DC-UbP/UBTD2 N-terminal domain-containing protein n=1 Tax=Aquilegia coerulea TaxID=218851 RepID=A0A2G5DEW9_AQUCA|nr:hypothetical protein AQUCO_02100107v1 [Aquilegia coerulea]